MRRFIVCVLLGLSVVATHAQEDCVPQGTSREQWQKTDFCQSSVDFNDIISGGPPKDGIPAVDNPVLETVEQARTWLADKSPVIMVDIDGVAHAYPQAILIWHEIANDVVNGVPVSVTFCPLCNSSIVFDRRVNGELLDFGVSGKLLNSDMVMYDRQTESWWQQFTGTGIVGTYTGTELTIIPSRVIGFGQFAQRYPDGLVLSRETGTTRNYGRNPYVGYDTANDPFLFRGITDPRLPANAHVLAGVIDGVVIAYSFTTLAEQGVINDTLGTVPVVAIWQSGLYSALDLNQIDGSRDIGTASLYGRVLDERELTFVVREDGTVRDEQTDSTWDVFGTAIAGELTGAQLPLLVAAPHFWFAWAAFQPSTAIYGVD